MRLWFCEYSGEHSGLRLSLGVSLILVHTDLAVPPVRAGLQPAVAR